MKTAGRVERRGLKEIALIRTISWHLLCLFLLPCVVSAQSARERLFRAEMGYTSSGQLFDHHGHSAHADEDHHAGENHHADWHLHEREIRPRGPGELAAQSPVTFTYSFSNLFDGQIDLRPGFSRNEVLRATEEGFALWASVAPIHFVELDDSGPSVSDNAYRRAEHPDIRIGHHSISGNVLAHAFFPGNNGRDSDIHMDSGNQIWKEGTFFSTMTHEIGHAIGLNHFDLSTAIMNSELSGDTIFNGLLGGKLFEPDIRAVTNKYGTGRGDVIVERRWSGGSSGQWSLDQNWDKVHYPTRWARVRVDSPAEIEVSEADSAARSLEFADADSVLRVTGGQLNVREDVTLGGSASFAHTNTIDVSRGRFEVAGNLRMAEGQSSKSLLEIRGGELVVGHGVLSGDGESRIVISDGSLTVNGTRNGPSFVSDDSMARILVPTDDSLGRSWIQPGFDDSNWRQAGASLGYERASGYEGLFDTDLESAMFDNSTSVYVRIPFVAEDAGSLNGLELDINFDDGFVAFLNGHRVAAQNAPNVPAFNERALTSVTDEDAMSVMTIDLSSHLGKIVNGDNVLALQGLNRTKTNDDFLLVPRLRTSVADGVIAVDEFEFLGGRVFGVNRIDGDVVIGGGQFSPDGATAASGPSTLQIRGSLTIEDDAALRIDMGADQIDRIAAEGPLVLNGALELVSSDSSSTHTVELGQVLEDAILSGSSITGRFSQVRFDDMPLGHTGGGVFRRLQYSSQDVTLLSYRTVPGDANGDGEFDSGDLVHVFQFDEYEDGIPSNSDWTEGDWTGDSEFDSSDFIMAFQSGYYETGSILATLVPEPSLTLGYLLGLLAAVVSLSRPALVSG